MFANLWRQLRPSHWGRGRCSTPTTRRAAPASQRPRPKHPGQEARRARGAQPWPDPWRCPEGLSRRWAPHFGLLDAGCLRPSTAQLYSHLGKCQVTQGAPLLPPVGTLVPRTPSPGGSAATAGARILGDRGLQVTASDSPAPLPLFTGPLPPSGKPLCFPSPPSRLLFGLIFGLDF